MPSRFFFGLFLEFLKEFSRILNSVIYMTFIVLIFDRGWFAIKLKYVKKKNGVELLVSTERRSCVPIVVDSKINQVVLV